MLYSLLVLTFGIYLGQEYPAIPLVKNVIKKTLVLFYDQDNNGQVKEKREEEEIINLGYSEVLLNSLKTILR